MKKCAKLNIAPNHTLQIYTIETTKSKSVRKNCATLLLIHEKMDDNNKEQDSQ